MKILIDIINEKYYIRMIQFSNGRKIQYVVVLIMKNNGTDPLLPVFITLQYNFVAITQHSCLIVWSLLLSYYNL